MQKSSVNCYLFILLLLFLMDNIWLLDEYAKLQDDLDDVNSQPKHVPQCMIHKQCHISVHFIQLIWLTCMFI